MTDTNDDVRVLNHALVADYLRRHPNFFLEQDDLLAQLHIPHQRGSSISLVERQMAVLRERNRDTQQKLGSLLGVARENDRLFELTRELLLGLLDAGDLAGLIAVLQDNLRSRFGLDWVSLLLFGEQGLDVVPVMTLEQVRLGLPSALQGKPLCGQLRPSELALLFGQEGAGAVASVALIPFGQPQLGVLALGSTDARHYSSGTGTLFPEFIGEVLARLLPPLLNPIEP